jgi:hypothetical protein
LELPTASKLNSSEIECWLNPQLWDTLSYKLLELKEYLIGLSNVQARIYSKGKLLTKTSIKLIDSSNYALNMNDLMAFKMHNPKRNLKLQLSFECPALIEDLNDIDCIEIDFPMYYSDINMHDIIQEDLFVNNLICVFNLYESYSKQISVDYLSPNYSLYENKYSNTLAYDIQELWKNNHQYEDFLDIKESDFFFNRQINKLVYEPHNFDVLNKKSKVFIKGLWTQAHKHSLKVKVSPSGLVIQGAKYHVIDVSTAVYWQTSDNLKTLIGMFKGFFALDIKKYENYIYILKYIFNSSSKYIVQDFEKHVHAFKYHSHNNSIHIYCTNTEVKPFISYYAYLVRDFFYNNISYEINIKISVACYDDK